MDGVLENWVYVRKSGQSIADESIQIYVDVDGGGGEGERQLETLHIRGRFHAPPQRQAGRVKRHGLPLPLPLPLLLLS